MQFCCSGIFSIFDDFDLDPPGSHKIYEIIASKSINEKNKGVQYDRCEYGSGLSFSDLLAMLRARYGDVFEITRNDYYSGYFEGKLDRQINIILIYSDNDRYIQLECHETFLEPRIIYTLSLEYIDSDLDKLEYKEKREQMNVKIAMKCSKKEQKTQKKIAKKC